MDKIHIAIILDGNRRFAKKNNMSNNEAYSMAASKVEELSNYLFEREDVGIISVFALSENNISKRPKQELKNLFKILHDRFKKIDKELLGKRKIHVLGLPHTLSGMGNGINEVIRKINTTYCNGKKTINILFGYSGQAEIVRAAKNFLDNFELFYPGEYIKNDKKVFEKGLLVKQPVDLIVRTSGERRLSGFLTYQTAQAQIYFEDKLFPEITVKDVEKWLDWYHTSERRYGK